MKTLGILKRKSYSELEVIEGLQQCEKQVEEWFYYHARSYFNEHFNEVFFDKDRKQEIFQAAFLKIWTEIHDKRIDIKDGIIVRQQRTGEYKPMTCSLTTFQMAFAKNEYREVLRSTHEDVYADFYDCVEGQTATAFVSFNSDKEESELKYRIIDETIQSMSSSCIEVLTLFYYENKNLDEIMKIRGERNSSKNGLKTAKNKCLTTLRERVVAEFQRFNLNV